MTTTARLLIRCPDRTGVIARVATFLADRGLNILDADQHTDPDTGRFFMRVEFSGGSEAAREPEECARIETGFRSAVGDPLSMDAFFHWPGRRKRIAVLVGPSLHCAADLLWRVANREIDCTITRVISNHTEARPLAERFGLPFSHVPVSGDRIGEAEFRISELLDRDEQEEGGSSALDLIVLARYMQVLSDAFVGLYRNRIINIHHSFLPAFAGARPYHQALDRGVKLIGATSHYATAELDDGPIIAQQTAHVSHRDTIDVLVRKGRDLERSVLAEAVRLHLDDRVLVEGRKTIVFD